MENSLLNLPEKLNENENTINKPIYFDGVYAPSE